MIEKIGTPGFETISTPDPVVLDNLKAVLEENPDPIYYEIGVGIGATVLEVARMLANRGTIILFSRASDVSEVAKDLADLGYRNVVDDWGSPSKTYSGYHFELARGFAGGLLPMFDLAYIDGGHVFHLDAAATAVLKELCRPGGLMLFDDYSWSLEASPTLNPTVRPQTGRDYDQLQIETAHVKLVCSVLMETDARFDRLGIINSTAIYRRKASASL
ncbi:MAG: class I SAM-dependent methyltransferase [Paracoccaceae bacterium]